MKVHATMLALAAVAAIAAFKPAPAQAEVWYPWCAQHAGGERGINATVCSFTSREQCMESIRGMGGFCMENPAPPPPAHRPVHR